MVFTCGVALAEITAFTFDNVVDGRKVVTTGGTAEQLSTSADLYRTLTVCAETNNTGVMAVGAATVVASLTTRRGIPLTAGACWTNQSSGPINLLYLDSTQDGDGVTFFYNK